MTDHDDPIGKIIKQAMDEGKFDNLPGAGKPFPKDDNPFEDPADWAANRVLKAAGFSLPWIEQRKDIEQMVKVARASLVRSWLWHRDNPAGEYNDARWQKAIGAFHEAVGEANRLILSYNLKVPRVEMQIVMINVDGEIKQVMES